MALAVCTACRDGVTESFAFLPATETLLDRVSGFRARMLRIYEVRGRGEGRAGQACATARNLLWIASLELFLRDRRGHT